MNGHLDMGKLMAVATTRIYRVVPREASTSQARIWPVYLLVAKYAPKFSVSRVGHCAEVNAFSDVCASAGNAGSAFDDSGFGGLLNNADPVLLVVFVFGYVVMLLCEKRPRPASAAAKLSAPEEDFKLGPPSGSAPSSACQKQAAEVQKRTEDAACLIQQKEEEWSRSLARALQEKEELARLLQQKEEELASRMQQSLATQAALDKAEEQLAVRQEELLQARQAGAELEAAVRKAEAKATEMKEAYDMEVEALEVMLEKARDQADHIIKQVKAQGCPLDAADGLSSKYVKDALNGRLSKRQSSVLVHYQGSLANPVAALVYEHDREEECSKVIAAFAVPKRGLTSMSLKALVESARRQGTERLVLDAVQGVVPFWEHLGFVPEHVEGPETCVPMSMSLGSGD